MRILNVHQRKLSAGLGEAGMLIDSLGSAHDRLWPNHSWPRMRFDRSLQVGAIGGHGPIRYFVESYLPGCCIHFRFTGPKGFNGRHRFEVIDTGPDSCLLRHTVDMTTEGPAIVSWCLLFGPLHDALIEDALAQAQASLGQSPTVARWSPWTRLLRWLISRGRGRAQVIPAVATD